MSKVRTKVVSGSLNLELPYKPLKKQAQAHALKAKYRSFCGGWGNGKTSWGCAETFIRLHEFAGTRAIIARKTRPELKQTTWQMFIDGDPGHPHAWHGIPRETVASINKSDLIVEFRNGSVVYGLPLDDPAKLENYNLGFFWIDQAEEVEEDIFLKFHGRLRQRIGPREGIVTWNPSGHSWLWRRFIDPLRRLEWGVNYKGIEATTYDNPTLPEDYLDQFIGLPEAWIQRFVFGSHEVFVGQIFTDWDPDIHIVQPFRIPSNWRRWRCFDPGIRHEAAASYIAEDFLGNKYYYRELLADNQPVSWWADQMTRMEHQEDWGGPNEMFYRSLIGPEANQRAQTDGRTVKELFGDYHFHFEDSDKQPAARISVITTGLRATSGHRNPFTGNTPAPQLYVFADCHKLIEYLPQYRWKPTRINYSEEDLPDKPRKKDDHNIDNLGHILLAIQDNPMPEFTQPRIETFEQKVVRELEEMAYAEAEAQRSSDYHPQLGAVV